MSHSVTITRTTTTTTGNVFFVNTGHLGTFPGLLKLAQLLLGAACVGIVGYYIDHNYNSRFCGQTPLLFFLLVSVSCLIGTFCLFASYLISLSTATTMPRCIYEVIYHGLAFILYLSAGLTLIIEVNHQKNYYGQNYEAFLAASIMGLVMAGLYLFSTFFANRNYRGF